MGAVVNRCPQCGARFQTMEDEYGEHPCPRCGFFPEESDDAEEDEEQ